MKHLGIVISLIVAINPGVAAGQDDPDGRSSDIPAEVADALAKESEVYAGAVRAAVADLLAAFDEEGRRVRSDTRISIDDRVRVATELLEQRSAFESERVEPQSDAMLAALARHKRRMTSAQAALDDAFDRVAKTYVLTKRELARTILDEKREVLAAVESEREVPTTATDETDIEHLAALVFASGALPDPLPAELSGHADLVRSTAVDLYHAREVHRSAQETSRLAVLRAFEDADARVMKDPRLGVEERIKRADALLAEREAFARTGVLPETGSLPPLVVTNHAKRTEEADARLRSVLDGLAARCIGDSLEIARALLAVRDDLAGWPLPLVVEGAKSSGEPATAAGHGPDSVTGVERARIVGHAGRVSAVLFRNQQIVTGSNSWTRELINGVYRNDPGRDNTVRYWAGTGEPELAVDHGLGKNQVQGFSMSRDGRMLAVATCRPCADWCDATVSIWSAGSDERLHCFSLPGRPGVWTPWFSPDERTVYAIRGDSSVHVLNLATDSVEKVLRLDPNARENDLRCAVMDAARGCVFGGMENGSIRQWRLNEVVEVRTFTGHARAITAVCLSSDGRRLASASEDGTARVFDVATGDQLVSCGLGVAATAVTFLGGQNRIVTGDAAGAVVVWEVQGDAARRVATFRGLTEAVLSLDVDDSEALLVAGSADKTAIVWSLPGTLRGKPRRR